MSAHKNPALPREGVMGEVELDLMLDALRMVMAAAPQQQDVLSFNEPPRTAWPIIPFPEGWYAG